MMHILFFKKVLIILRAQYIYMYRLHFCQNCDFGFKMKVATPAISLQHNLNSKFGYIHTIHKCKITTCWTSLINKTLYFSPSLSIHVTINSIIENCKSLATALPLLHTFVWIYKHLVCLVTVSVWKMWSSCIVNEKVKVLFIWLCCTALMCWEMFILNSKMCNQIILLKIWTNLVDHPQISIFLKLFRN